MTADPTLPRPQGHWAWFLDLDGTLIDIAPSPRDVVVPGDLVAALERLRRAARGALAVISGRPIVQVHALLAPLAPAAAGLHGLERLTAAGDLLSPTEADPRLAQVRRALAEFAAHRPGVLFEDKELTLALHYRNAPGHEAAARRAVAEAVDAAGGAYETVDGKMVLEVRPAGIHKGGAVQAFMTEPPFAGRLAVYAGDDTTDEDAFAAVNDLGGISILVGPERPTKAQLRVPSTAALRRWLAGAAAAMEGA